MFVSPREPAPPTQSQELDEQLEKYPEKMLEDIVYMRKLLGWLRLP